MFGRKILIALSVLALVTLACGVSFNLPVTDIKTGPVVSEDIQVPLLEDASEVAELTLRFGAGELNLTPGAEETLVSGTATYNIADFSPDVTIEGNQISIETGSLEIQGIPNFGKEYRNEWDLELSDAPMELRINAGAYQGRFELGGLTIHSLKVADGAADVRLSFSEPNKIEMDTLRYDTGASSVVIEGLANANFDQMIFRSGAGDYSLDFSGELLRDTTVTIDSGLSNVTVIVPRGVSARVFVDRDLANVDIGGDWEKEGNEYIQTGEGPRITINVNIEAGNLELRN